MMFSGMTGVARSKTRAEVLRASMGWAFAGFWILSVTLCGSAATIENMQRARSSGVAAAKTAHPAASAAGQTGTSRRSVPPPKSRPESSPLPVEAAAHPAEISLQNGSLTIEADNSDLAQILRKVASLSGMTIDGLTSSSRIFGRYGPGGPRDVLTHLLTGSGYNFIMAGDTPDGVPRELLLTAQTGPASAAPNPPTAPAEPVSQAEPAPQPQDTDSANQNPTPAAPKPADAEQMREIRMQQFLHRLQSMREEHGQDAPE